MKHGDLIESTSERCIRSEAGGESFFDDFHLSIGSLLLMGIAQRGVDVMRTLMNASGIEFVVRDMLKNKGAKVLRHGRDVHPTWVEGRVPCVILTSTGVWFVRLRSEEGLR